MVLLDGDRPDDGLGVELSLPDGPPVEAGPQDLGPDLPSALEAGGDALTSDASLSSAGVLYAVGAPGALGLRTVRTDAPGTPKQVPGFQGGIDFAPLTLTSLVPATDAVADVAHPFDDGKLGGIRLPDRKGRLLYFHRKLTGTSGLVVARADGSVEVLVEVFGLYAGVIDGSVALDDAGVTGAALHPPAEVHLFRTDGAALATGGVTTVPGIPAGIDEIRGRSLTLAGGWLYAVGVEAGGERRLLRAAADGASPFQIVTLAAEAPTYVADELARSADGAYLAVVAGSAATTTDVFRVEAASGQAINLSNTPADHAPRGAVLGLQEGKLAISSAGGRVAFVRRAAGLEELYVVDAAGASLPLLVTSNQRFKVDVIWLVNLLFVDDHRLLFTGGGSAGDQDLFVWDSQLQEATNLTRPQQTVPLGGGGARRPQGAWIDRGRTRLALLAEDQGAQQTTVYEVDLGPGDLVARAVFDAGIVVKEPSATLDCGSSLLLVAAEPTTNRRAIWQLDRAGGADHALPIAGPPAKGPWTISHLAVDPGCGRLLWTGGGGANLRTLWRAGLAPAASGAAQLTAVPRFFGVVPVVTADGTTAVYASGGSETTAVLRAVPLLGGPPTTLDGTAGQVHVLAVF